MICDYNYPWVPDQQDGTYRNPVLYADYSDPDAIRDGDDFWMTASSFNCTPGLPILHSRDLVNWKLVNYAIQNNPDPRGVFHTVQPGCGVWAPAIRKHAGLFWIFFPLPDEGIYVTTATDPRGQWSEPWLLLEGKGFIDPCPLWDEDGKAYLVHAYANSRCGIKHRLRVVEMTPDARQLIGQGRVVFDQPERHPTCEGPKFMKKDGYYYIAAPAGGVATGWQLILRARDVWGPYEEKVVLEQGKTPINGPHQGAYVDTPDGRWWFLHFQDVGVYGRIVHLQPVEWKDGWPMTGIDQDGNGIGEPVLHHVKPIPGKEIVIPETSDEFNSPVLGLQWQWHANHRPDWASLSARKGWLRLYAQQAQPQLRFQPNLLLQKFPTRCFTVETRISLQAKTCGTEAGLTVMGRSHAALVIAKTGECHQLVYRVDDRVIHTRQIRSAEAVLKVSVESGGNCVFSFGFDDLPSETVMGTPFQASEGHWIGAKVGLFVRGPSVQAEEYADIDYFRFGPIGSFEQRVETSGRGLES
ncbi:MAG: glycoside hydrolase [Phycisphaerae bacterium]|jgi:beta-xylosidase|nr:MAG: glycoside hydrolase [Phycisphaerae bacterium]